MRQARYPYKIRERFRLRIYEHLYDKIGSKLRNTQASELTSADVFGRDPKRLGGAEQAHDRLVIKRHLPRIRSGKILKHPYHRRIIVSQYVKL